MTQPIQATVDYQGLQAQMTNMAYSTLNFVVLASMMNIMAATMGFSIAGAGALGAGAAGASGASGAGGMLPFGAGAGGSKDIDFPLPTLPEFRVEPIVTEIDPDTMSTGEIVSIVSEELKYLDEGVRKATNSQGRILEMNQIFQPVYSKSTKTPEAVLEAIKVARKEMVKLSHLYYPATDYIGVLDRLQQHAYNLPKLRPIVRKVMQSLVQSVVAREQYVEKALKRQDQLIAIRNRKLRWVLKRQSEEQQRLESERLPWEPSYERWMGKEG